MGDKVAAADKQQIEDATAALKKAMEGNDTDDIKAKTEALKNASYKIAEEVYKQQGAQGGAAPNGAGESAGASGGDAGSSSGFDNGKAEDVVY